MPTRLPVQVDADQFDRLSRPTQPLAAVAELVWNALDAEANSVVVSIARTELDAVDHVVILDNGHGMTNAEAVRDFGRLGGSRKRGERASRTGKRTVHGQHGEGRFRAFAVGVNVTWETRAEAFGGGLERTVIEGDLRASEFIVSDPEAMPAGATGTSVSLTTPRDYVNRLLAADAMQGLVTRFAAYLLKYPYIHIFYDNHRLDPATLMANERVVVLPEDLGGSYGSPEVRIVEWKPGVPGPSAALVLCDENGVALGETTEDLASATGLRYSAYLTWAGFATYTDPLSLGNLGHEDIAPILAAAREAIDNYVSEHVGDQQAAVIKDWKERGVYPYRGAAASAAQLRQRRLFNLVAVAAAPAIAQEKKAARLSLWLLREAVEDSPSALHRVLTEVLGLTEEQVEDFDRLLNRTSLPAMIEATSLVIQRLEFMHDLEKALFDPVIKQALLERSQLQVLLSPQRSWVFGEEYSMAVNEGSLTTVLKTHLHLFAKDAPLLDPVRDGEGRVRRVDLMLSRAVKNSEGRRHLVVELKRPTVTLGMTEIGQIQNYAITVARDERFRSPSVFWDFWLVGNDLDAYAEEMTHQDGLPEGVSMQKDTYRVHVRRWCDIIEENRQRLHFYRDRLNFRADEDVTLEEITQKHRLTEESAVPDAAA